MCDVFVSVVVPLAGPGVLHAENKVFLDGASVSPSHHGGDVLQRQRQTPDLLKDCGQELVGILNTHRGF